MYTRSSMRNKLSKFVVTSALVRLTCPCNEIDFDLLKPQTVSQGGELYIMTGKDDYSRYVWTYSLAQIPNTASTKLQKPDGPMPGDMMEILTEHRWGKP